MRRKSATRPPLRTLKLKDIETAQKNLLSCFLIIYGRMIHLNYLENYSQWCSADISDAELQELRSIREQEDEIKSRFNTELQFGTAGMRGVMGMGCNRLNRFTVRRAAQGMAAWLLTTDLPKLAAIAYDSRHNSESFAKTCAVAFAEAGIKTWLFDRLAPTPMLSFAIRHFGCGCGVVISASHNSGIYNGVKCYGPDGCQMTDEPAAVVTEMISKIPYFVKEQKSFDGLMAEGMVCYIQDDLWQAYYNAVLAEALTPQVIKNSGLRVVYTPLCGTGNEPVREALGRLGVDIIPVSSQEKPDGDFKTCEYPNPETDAALAESYTVADSVPCDLILGTDPDADRVAIAIPNGTGDYQKLTGNELGCLLLEYILEKRRRQASIPAGAIAVRSIVSSPMADRIAAYYGVQMVSVLTGFKYIGGEILRLEERGEADRFVFGFEESCGYLKGTYARDKDAVCASILICEMAAEYKRAGKTILDALRELYDRYGYYQSSVKNLELSGADAMQKAAGLMTELRESAPAFIGGEKVTVFRDYKTGIHKDYLLNTEKPISLPKSNVLEFVIGERGNVIVRPSGTEPKVKFYFTAIGDDKDQARALLDQMKAQFQ